MRRVLLVEDSATARGEIMRVLTFELGALVHPHQRYMTARSALSTMRFDVAVIDLVLPDGDGIDLARLIRRQEAASRERAQTRVILCTTEVERAQAVAAELHADVASKRHLVRDLRAALSVHEMPTRPQGL